MGWLEAAGRTHRLNQVQRTQQQGLLAAALAVRTGALLAATPGWRCGPYWGERARNLGADGAWPRAQEVLDALDALQAPAVAG